MKNKIHKISRFLKLRPVVAWSSFSLITMLVIIITVSWTENSSGFNNFRAEDFTVIDINIPEPEKFTEPEILINDNSSENISDTPREDKPDLSQFAVNFPVPPVPRFHSLPSYPDSMRSKNIEGVVIIELAIDNRGTVVYSRIISSLGQEFDKSVISWSKNIRFRPARDLERKPIPCLIHLPVRFKLDS